MVVKHATRVAQDLGRFSDTQPPETAGKMMISSPGTNAVSRPSRSRMGSFPGSDACRRDFLRQERDIEIIIEVGAVRRDPSEAPRSVWPTYAALSSSKSSTSL